MLTGKPSDILNRWAQAMRDPHDGTEPDVKCGACSACCRSGYTIDLQEGESGEGLDVVERRGVRVLRQNPDGSCVHVTDAGCSVYDKRPITCRRFDCRVYALAGLVGMGREVLNNATLSWTFNLDDDADVIALLAYRLAARTVDSPNVETSVIRALRVRENYQDEAKAMWEKASDEERAIARKRLASPRLIKPC